MKDLYDIKNWKRTMLKEYEAYLCKPQLGTLTFDKTSEFSGLRTISICAK